jgi:hypothetical protein
VICNQTTYMRRLPAIVSGIGADHAAQSHDADGQCREKKSLNCSILEALRRSIKGGPR